MEVLYNALCNSPYIIPQNVNSIIRKTKCLYGKARMHLAIIKHVKKEAHRMIIVPIFFLKGL